MSFVVSLCGMASSCCCCSRPFWQSQWTCWCLLCLTVTKYPSRFAYAAFQFLPLLRCSVVHFCRKTITISCWRIPWRTATGTTSPIDVSTTCTSTATTTHGHPSTHNGYVVFLMLLRMHNNNSSNNDSQNHSSSIHWTNCCCCGIGDNDNVTISCRHCLLFRLPLRLYIFLLSFQWFIHTMTR